jgi:hypothetical protein
VALEIMAFYTNTNTEQQFWLKIGAFDVSVFLLLQDRDG